MFGLSLFISSKRAKEISLKKILGASPGHLMWTLVKDGLLLVIIGAMMASPFVMLGGRYWLEDYHARISLSPSILLLPVLTILVLSQVIVIGNCWKTAQSNPLEVIRQD